MAYKFIVNTEDVNEYGYRVLTDGIDTEQYMRNPVVLFQHTRFDNENKGSEVIGKCVKLYKEDSKLIAEIEFDTEDEFAKKIEGKVKREYIRMCSMYGDAKETSMEPEYLLPGQIFETVTKSKLVEISITDIGGNDGALRLTRNGAPIKLQKLNINTDTMSFKTIALALGIDANSSEDIVLNKVQGLQKKLNDANDEIKLLKQTAKEQETATATELVDKAIKLNLIPEALKASQIKAFDGDFQNQKVTLTKLIETKEAEDGKTNKIKLVKEVISGAKPAATPNADGYQKGDFIKLSKENPNELARMKREEPEEFKQIFKAEYGVEPTI